MKSKLLLFAVLMLLLMNTAISQEAEKRFNTLNEQAIEVSYGKNATAQLPMLSKTYITIHEGSRLDFNVVDPDNFRILIHNNPPRGTLSVRSHYDSVFADDSENRRSCFQN